MPVGSDPAKKKSYASKFPYPVLVIGTPAVDHEDRLLLYLFKSTVRFPVTQRKVDTVIREDFGIAAAFEKRDPGTIDQQGFGWVQAKAFDIKLLYVIIKTVVLGWVNGIKL